MKTESFDPGALWERVNRDLELLRELVELFSDQYPALLKNVEAARESVRHCIQPLARALEVDEIEAYAMTGLIAELRILEVVDVPNWVVGCMLPRRLFE